MKILHLPTALLTLVIACHALGQTPPKCVPTSQIVAANERLSKLGNEVSAHQAKFLRALDARSDALTAVNQCRSERNIIDDLTNTFTLQPTKCNAAIDTYNMQNLQVENEKQVVDALLSMQENLAKRIASASLVACGQ
jgi:hypothetical protein